MAEDIVHHFLNRGYQGKAMVVSIDKLTALRMYGKVRAEWEAEKAWIMDLPQRRKGRRGPHSGLSGISSLRPLATFAPLRSALG